MNGLFKMYYYAEKLGLGRDVIDIYIEHKLRNAAVKFYQKWNQIPSAPEYEK